MEMEERANESLRHDESADELLLCHDEGGVGRGGREIDFLEELTLRPRPSVDPVLDLRW